MHFKILQILSLILLITISNEINNNNENPFGKIEYSNQPKETKKKKKNNDIILNSQINKLYNGEDYIIQIYNSSTSSIDIAIKQQLNTSIIDFHNCINYLESKYGSPIIIYKIDLKREKGITNQIEYSIYSKNGNEIPLSECLNYKITLSSPLNLINTSLDIKKINSTGNEGYDIFNAEDNFYTDICTPYTNENGIDVPMKKRKSDYYISMDFCEENCEYVSFDYEHYRVNCSCSIKTSINNEANATFSTNSISSDSDFYNLYSNSNILVFKCFKLVFSKKGFSKNWGSYFALLIIIIQIILTIFYFVIQLEPLKKQIKFFTKKTIVKEINSHNNENNNSNKKDENDEKQNNSNNNINIINSNEDLIDDQNNLYQKNPSNPPNEANNKLNIIDDNENQNNENTKTKKDKNLSLDNNSLKSNNSSFSNNSNTTITISSINGYTHDELNVLPFEDALIYDTRKIFFEHYYSILKYDQLIIFTFFNNTDYNLRIFKLSLFFWCILMYIVFNAIFYSDSTMNNVYDNNGSLQIISVLPKTIFSSLCCSIITFLLKFLSLSHGGMQKIKDEKDLIKQKEKAIQFEKCFKIKVSIFFIIIFILLILFWYYLSAFCAVYKNSQKHLFKDTAISFLISMIYPFIICFFASLFRYFSLKKNSKCLYVVSRIIQFF